MQKQPLKIIYFITNLFYLGLLPWMGEGGIGSQTSKSRVQHLSALQVCVTSWLWNAFWGGSGKGQSPRAGQGQRWPGTLGIWIQVENKHWSASLSLKHPIFLLVSKTSSSETPSELFSEIKQRKMYWACMARPVSWLLFRCTVHAGRKRVLSTLPQNGQLVTMDKEKPEVLNNFFASLFNGSLSSHTSYMGGLKDGGWASKEIPTVGEDQVHDHQRTWMYINLWNLMRCIPKGTGWGCCQATFHDIQKVIAVRWSPR